jgi:hypothetical protein
MAVKTSPALSKCCKNKAKSGFSALSVGKRALRLGLQRPLAYVGGATALSFL